MKKWFFLVLFVLAILIGCRSAHLGKIEGKQLSINDSLVVDNDIENFIQPYRSHINKSLDSVISYAFDTYSKKDGKLNTAIGNMMAESIYEEANPVFKKRTGKNIDIVLLNYGGIRSIISKGVITKRTAYKVMPFENSVVVAEMQGDKVIELVNYLVNEKKAHPIHNLKIVLNPNGALSSATIKGEPIDLSRTYYVATSDYLYNGGDRMTFFQPNNGLYELNYKIRNILIDYFSKRDTIAPQIDDRFIQLKP